MAEEGSGCLVGDGFGKKGLAGSGRAVQDDTFGWFDAHLLVEFGMQKGQLDGLADFLDLLFEAADVCVALRRRLVELHHRDKRVGVVGQDTYYAHALVV